MRHQRLSRWPSSGHPFRAVALAACVALLGALAMSLLPTSGDAAEPAPGDWSPTGSPHSGGSHAATKLPDGRVLSSSARGAEIYDPASERWTLTNCFGNAKDGATVTQLGNGKVLVAGGRCNLTLPTAEVYDPATGTWSSTAPMAQARTDHTATLLGNGKVLVTGGSGTQGEPLSLAEIYDPATGTWTKTGRLREARVGPTATRLTNGKVLVAAGYVPNEPFCRNDGLASAELYDPATGTFSPTGSMLQSSGREGHTATAVAGGRVLVVGGYYDDRANCAPRDTRESPPTAELYDPLTGQWLPAAPMLAVGGRTGHTATALSNGKVFVAGGGSTEAEVYDPATNIWTPAGTVGNFTSATLLRNGKVLMTGGSSAALYDPDTKTSSTVASLSTSRGRAAVLLDSPASACGTNCGKVLVVGVSAPGKSLAELYDPTATANVWTPTGPVTTTTGRHRHSATLVEGGKVLVAGGAEPSADGRSFDKPQASAELLDPATGGWSTTGAMSVPRFAHTATPLEGGKVLVAGGTGADGKPLGSSETYDPASGSWTKTPGSLGQARSGHTATPLGGGKVLVVGGRGEDGKPLAAAEVYDPASGGWSTTANPLATARADHSATQLPGGRVLVVGGRDGDGRSLASSELYDPATGAWSSCAGESPSPACPAALREGRYAHSATALADGRILVAGGRSSDSVKALATAELYDPATGAWSSAGRLARQAVPRGGGWILDGLSNHTATLLSDGRILVAGGLTVTYQEVAANVAQLYDPAPPRRFSTAAPRPTTLGGYSVVLDGPLCRLSSAPGYCGKVLVAGGSDASSALYDPQADTWVSGCAAGDGSCTPGPLRPGTLNAVPRDGGTVTRLADGKVLLVGGRASSSPPQDVAATELYDPATGKWTTCASTQAANANCPAPYPGDGVSQHTATLLSDGRVLVAGGIIEKQFPRQVGGTRIAERQDFSIYNPATGLWTSGTLYNSRRQHAAVLLAGDQCGGNCGKVLIVGGQGADSREAELLDPATNTSVGNTPTPIAQRYFGHSATLLQGGKVLVAGGMKQCPGNCREPQETTELFDPKTGAWEETGRPLLPLGSVEATALRSSKVLMQGNQIPDSPLLYDAVTEKWTSAGRYVGQYGSHPKPTLLPSGPRSLCGTSCGKVVLLGTTYDQSTQKSSNSTEIYTPPPEVTRIVAPTSGPTRGGTAVTLVGSGLASVASVKFGKLEATSVTPDADSPDTKLVAVSPPHPAGTVPVTATSSGGTSPRTERAQFTYTGSAGGGAGGGGATGGGATPGGARPGGTTPGGTTPGRGGPQRGRVPAPEAGAEETSRARALRSCMTSAARHARRDRRRLRRGSVRRRAKAKRHLRRHRNSLRRRCLARHGRTPGRIGGLSARAVSKTKVELSFLAPGTDRSRSPAAHSYLVKQSRRPIRGRRAFRRAQTLCRGSCRFDVTRVGARLRLTITDLRPGSSYYYAIAARDNVSRRLGPRSGAVRVRTR